MICGVISGRNYSEGDIFDPVLYPRMKEEPLLDGDDCLVVPVRNKTAPHFRRVGPKSFGKRIGRSENNPTHDQCVQYMFDELSAQPGDVKFSTYVFNEERKFEEQVIFCALPDSDYRWCREADARVAFHDEKYIQPDLAGRDANRFFPRSSCPNIIVEVIRTHAPDGETFERLVELSKENCHVYIYFVGEGKRGGKLNNLKLENGKPVVRVSHYLIGGVLYRNGAEAPGGTRRANETMKQWYTFLSNSYFKQAMEAASK